MFFWETPLILIFYTYIFGVSEDINNKLINVNFDLNKLIIANNEEPFVVQGGPYIYYRKSVLLK